MHEETQSPATAPTLEHVTTIQAEVGPIGELGVMPLGRRRIIPILGGTMTGPRLTGTVVGGGADWQIVRPDGVIELTASYSVRTADGVEISVINSGLRRADADTMARLSRGEPVDPALVYCRTAPRFEAPSDSAYDWLNRSLFIADVQRRPDSVQIAVFEVR